MGQANGTFVDHGSRNLYSNDENWTINITVNNEVYKVTKELSPSTSLNDFIRDVVELKGTKFMCLEGGCGSCIVAIERNDETLAINSCLVPVYLCDGLKITTIEGLGNKKTGYNTLQASLAHMNGTQCGFCSPGMVMNMYSLLQNGKITQNEIEKSFGSNICRCTGYRPILETFKMFASDALPKSTKQIHDIEEIYGIKTCKRSGKQCQGNCGNFQEICSNSVEEKILTTTGVNSKFYQVHSIKDLFNLFESHPTDSYILNGGNTGHGVYRIQTPNMLIDINRIPELKRIERKENVLIIGSGVTLTNAKKAFVQYSAEKGFEYLKELANHIELIASIPVRNIATIAGNLMLKHQNHEFPSDMFLILETVGTKIHILESPAEKKIMNLYDFVHTSMQHKVIYSLELPIMEKEYVLKTFKIMPRAQNAHAIINAGFLFKMNGNNKVMEKPNMIFGGIKPNFLHACKTEEYLMGKHLTTKSAILDALKILDNELDPDHVLPDKTPEYRKLLAQGLFYKFILGINMADAKDYLRSGESMLQRELSHGVQSFDTDKKLWPVNQPVPKLEAVCQTSGEAEYVNDIPKRHNEAYCAFTLAEAPGRIEKIDTSEAMNMEGVIAFFTSKDIPGKNAFVAAGLKYDAFFVEDELLFADKDVTYAGQPYGMVVAKSQNMALEAAKKINLVYAPGPKRKPIITVQDAIASKDKTRIINSANYPATKSPGKDIKHVIKGTFEAGSQYHYTLETQCCVCIPTENGIDVYSSTQFIDATQSAISELLGIPNNSLDVRVRRLGGGYGAKISRCNLIACGCALACHLLNLPVRFIMTLEDNMKSIGKRYATTQEYEIGVNENGVIQYLNSSHWGNGGNSFNEQHADAAIRHMFNCYDSSSWNCIGYEVKTDIPANTWCRSPGSCEGVAMSEHMMEHIAKVSGKDPIDVRFSNMQNTAKEALQPMVEELKISSKYDDRKVAIDEFNSKNRWKKRGIAFVCMKYIMDFYGQYHALVSIYAQDGTVSITHGGIEMGQGINTKVAQVAAHAFGIDLNMITVKPSNNLTSTNDTVSGGSQSSESCAYATLMSCKELLKRLEPIKGKMDNPKWKDLIRKAFSENVDLTASCMYSPTAMPINYPIYGAAVAEVEVDILTGQHIISRADIIEDVGISLSPLIDVGQVEGAFVMGLGYWTTEELIYDPQTGSLTNFRTWNYKPPGAMDIPVDFRVTFRRNAPNPIGVIRSKATGEPPLCMSCVLPLAIRNAIDSARKDAGNNDVWYPLYGPVTSETILLSSLTNKEAMIL